MNRILADFRIDIKQKLCWNREGKIKVWILKDNDVKEMFTNIIKINLLLEEVKSAEEEWVGFTDTNQN
jgi:hypothetical protein